MSAFRFSDGLAAGAGCFGAKGRFERCVFSGHSASRGSSNPMGFLVQSKGAPSFVDCVFEDNDWGLVMDSSSKKAALGVETTNIFRGNERGNVKRG